MPKSIEDFVSNSLLRCGNDVCMCVYVRKAYPQPSMIEIHGMKKNTYACTYATFVTSYAQELLENQPF